MYYVSIHLFLVQEKDFAHLIFPLHGSHVPDSHNNNIYLPTQKSRDNLDSGHQELPPS